jgi:hypothetical protein
VLGHTVPRAARITQVTLDGRAGKYRVRHTNRGNEVLVEVCGQTSGPHVLVVRTAT